MSELKCACYNKITPVFDEKTPTYCTLPYPGHPKGCPMFGTRKECPPEAPHLRDFLDLTYPVIALVCSFDLAGHMRRMKEAHPHWTERQQRNPLYWQNGVRKRLTENCMALCQGDQDYVYTLIPEAMRVNVVETMARVGVQIIFPATDVVHKIAFVGRKKGGE